MLGPLGKLFGRRDDGGGALARLARGRDRARFLQRIGQADVQVIAAPVGEGLDPHAMTREQLLAEVERAAKDLSERTDGFAPFVFEREGRRRIPFFTSDARAQAFVAEYSRERDRVYPFQLLTVRGVLLARLAPACDEFAMNDRSPDEVILGDADRAAMLRAWG
jgi:hypothetical protein